MAATDQPALTIPAVLRLAADRFGDRIAYVEGSSSLSFTDLLDRVRETARGYLALGLRPGDRLVLWAPNSVDWVIAALAATYPGATLVPVNSRYTGPEVAEIVERTDARLVVVADGFLGRTQAADLRAALPQAGQRRLVLLSGTAEHANAFVDLPGLGRDVDAAVVEQYADQVTPETVADILFTSGTTGRSKGAMSANRQTVATARTWGQLGGVTETDRYLVVNPFFHSFGYKVGIITGLITGATLYPLATFDPDQLMAMVAEHEITVLPGAPTIYQSMLASPRRGEFDLSSLRLAVTGAAVVPVVLIERMRAELGIDQVVTAFGMTEAVVATMARKDDPAELVARTVGRAVPGVETRIAAPGTNDPLPAGSEGELLLRGDIVMLGYLDDPAATAEAIDSDGWLHTGDIGILDEAGNLKITDRLKDMYISGGFNVYPAEVEQTLARMPGVTDCAVIGIPDERMGEVGRAFVVVADSGPTADEVIAFAKQQLANFKVPREVELVTAIPRNLSGKILKNELRGRA